jgi:hypothetical protein
VPRAHSREPPISSRRKSRPRPDRDDRRLVTRPFAGRADETEWVALREVVPAATAPLRLRDDAERDVTLSTVLPLAWPAMVRADGRVFLGLQVAARSGDVSRDLGWALELALAAEPGTAVQPVGLPGPGPRLQDLLADDPIEVTVHEGFDYWVDGAVDEDSEVAESLEQANATVVPTTRLTSVPSASGSGRRPPASSGWPGSCSPTTSPTPCWRSRSPRSARPCTSTRSARWSTRTRW